MGVAVVASGLMQVVNASFVRLVAQPSWLPMRPVLAVASGVVLVVVGVALMLDRQRRPAALVWGGLLGIALLLRLPEIAANPGAGFVWTNPAKIGALIGGALLLASPAPRAVAWAAGLLAVFLCLGGVQHFVYAGFVDTLVPAWIPPGQRFWTCATGGALVAGGIGLLIPATRWWAAVLSGVMIFLWVVLLHVPRSVEMKNAFELAGVFEALAVAGICWLMAGKAGARAGS